MMTPTLLPRPRSVEMTGAGVTLRGLVKVSPPMEDLRAGQALLLREFRSAGLQIEECPEAPMLRIEIDGAVSTNPGGYQLTIQPEGILLVGQSARGLHHALMTLVQIARNARIEAVAGGQDTGRLELPGLTIHDAPELVERGVLLDVSRDRVPTTETLLDMIELLAIWKVNSLQLYTEHTFAYAGHEVVWEDASPITPDEIRHLDEKCRSLFIDLIPNQQSFGHMHRWLIHEPYRALAECPDGIPHPFSAKPEPFSLCPLDPGSLLLIEDLYDQLLPCFSARELNTGLDETFDLGQGRSRAACEDRGVGRVYLEFLQAVADRALTRGVRPQFWADVIFEHPELIPEIPPESIHLLWGYEAEHPFAPGARTLAEAEREFVICPGTGSWRSLGGRTNNTNSNITRAIESASGFGARGILITDWGDAGHLQPLPVSLPGIALAADLAWRGGGSLDRIHLARALDRIAFEDGQGKTGAALLALGDAGEALGIDPANTTPLFILLDRAGASLVEMGLETLDLAGLARAQECLDAASSLIAEADPRGFGGELVNEELAWVAGILGQCVHLGEQLVRAGAETTATQISASRRERMGGEISQLIESYGSLWPRRSRPGGRSASTDHLESFRAALAMTARSRP